MANLNANFNNLSQSLKQVVIGFHNTGTWITTGACEISNLQYIITCDLTQKLIEINNLLTQIPHEFGEQLALIQCTINQTSPNIAQQLIRINALIDQIPANLTIQLKQFHNTFKQILVNIANYLNILSNNLAKFHPRASSQVALVYAGLQFILD